MTSAPSPPPPTICAYMEDTEMFTGLATVLKATPNAKDGLLSLVLDRTLFHPQGGGQPSDEGTIELRDGTIFPVRCLVGREGSAIEHLIDGSAIVHDGDSVVMHIDKDKRILHARLHSAGHLLDVAMDAVGPAGLTPTKGYHFASGPYVEYAIDGEWATEAETLRQSLETELNRLCEEAIDVEVHNVRSLNALAALCEPPPYAVEAYRQDAGKEYRVVVIGGPGKAHSGCPCGGTHVPNTSAIGRVSVKKVKAAKVKGQPILKVSYVLN